MYNTVVFGGLMYVRISDVNMHKFSAEKL